MEVRSPSGTLGPQPADGFSPPWPTRWRVATHGMDSSACVRQEPWQALFSSRGSDEMTSVWRVGPGSPGLVRTRSGWASAADRKPDPDKRALFPNALDFDASAVFRNDSVGDGEAKA